MKSVSGLDKPALMPHVFISARSSLQLIAEKVQSTVIIPFQFKLKITTHANSWRYLN
ncbi:MAG: hypothetical protein R3C26_18485 [Calditrichia bacterium]